MRITPLIFSAGLLVAVASCSGHHRIYPGPALPREQVAILRTIPQPVPNLYVVDVPESLLLITKIDKHSAPSHAFKDHTVRLELLPGVHELKVRLNGAGTGFSRIGFIKSQKQAVLKLDARAGHD